MTESGRPAAGQSEARAAGEPCAADDVGDRRRRTAILTRARRDRQVSVPPHGGSSTPVRTFFD
ncbi:hypothetical protein [Pseudofrankia asymbiotica]|uniref:Uncharacterized protein n=1 Tax=Pseudofrankia asymbiotica TaxID=1834516 RepID=A0A1V2IKI2_9ACTN|nr:hypothetical protein [Pseudofrankia asymbiotica]ONH33617.1 hypothetical protein BL253_00940 [Pseudofrankia asymbiotica]